MKKVTLIWALLAVLAVGAQENYFTTYNFVVEPQNQATVYKLIDDYYSKNKPDGIFVRLFENHFKDAGNKATHSIVFLGTREAVGAMYSGGGNDSFDLFLTRLNQHIKESAGSAMGQHLAAYGNTEPGARYPAQIYLLLEVEDPVAFEEQYNKFHSKHNPEGVIVVMGNILAGASPEGENRWAIIGYKDMQTAMGGREKMFTGAALAAREKAWNEFMANHGGVKVVRSGMRFLLGAWQ